MTLKEISYELLLIIRGGFISDDERIDLRLLEAPIKQYRAEYINDLNRIEKRIPESFVQTFNVPLSIVNNTMYNSLESTSELPKIAIGRFGPLISGVYSPYVDEYSYTIVNRNQLRTSGNGKFNKNIIFVSYFDDKLKLKSNNQGYLNMTDVNISTVLYDPTDAPDFDINEDDYPINEEAIPYIKDKMGISEIKLLLAQITDEDNDADGEIKK